MNSAYAWTLPDYSVALGACVLLAVWSFIGVVLVGTRIYHWKSVRPNETGWWMFAAAVSATVGFVGIAHGFQWENNAWLVPSLVGALSISVAGIAVVWHKQYIEPATWELPLWLVTAAAFFFGWTFWTLYHFLGSYFRDISST